MRRLSALAGVVAVGAACVITSVGVANAASGRTVLKGSAPAWANSTNLKGTADPNGTVGFRVYLGWTDESAAQSLAAAVSTPGNAQYREFLTPAQFRQKFAPSQASVTAVQSWLRSQGFTVDYTPQNNHYVAAEGTVAQAQTAFGTTMGVYSVDGQTVDSPEADVSVPDSLSGVVSSVVGLDDSAQFVHTNHTDGSKGDGPPPAAFVPGQPCSNYWGEKPATGFTNPVGTGTLPYTPCGYTPQQVRGAYGVPSSATGAGQSVAIIDAYASPTMTADANQWSANHGVPQFKAGQFTQVVAPGTFKRPNNKRQDPTGWSTEETLDVEAVHGVAPAANIVYVGAPNNYRDLDAALNYVVDKNVAPVVTNSYGFSTELLPQGYINSEEDTIVQGAIEGIGIYFSSGDNGDESAAVGYRTADWPASSPFVTAVGGTSLAVGASNNYLFETGWGTTAESWNGSAWVGPPSYLYGAGGGVSMIAPEPSYQQGVVQQAVFNAQGRTGRSVPDVSAFGDPNTGYTIGQTQAFPDGSVKYSEFREGGTSLSSPIIAGIMALANQAAGHPLGFANPLLYSLSGTSAVHDVVNPSSTVAVVRTNYVNSVDSSGGLAYSLRIMNQTQSLATTPGYDDVTGVGTPAAGFISALASH